jgi:predicted dehydrogenase
MPTRSSASRPRLRFAVIGCGTLAQAQHLPNLNRSSKAQLVACCDLDQVHLDYCARTWGVTHLSQDYHQTIADPDVDAICLATTERLRLPVIAAAAAAGKPVYVEKPLARELDEMYAIQKEVHQSGIPLCVGFNRRNSPAMITAHRIFRQHMDQPQPCAWRFDREGSGRPHLAEDGTAVMSVRINDDWYSWKGWVFDPEHAPHGPMVFEMGHFTDLCNWFLQAEPEEVVAAETGMLNHAVTIRYRTGEIATITTGSNGSFGYPKELYELMGQGGVVVIDHMLEVRTAGITGAPERVVLPLIGTDHHPDVGTDLGLFGWLAKTRAAAAEAVATGDPMRQFAAAPDKGHAAALDRFVDEIRGEGPPVCGVDDAVRAMRVCFAAVRSAREHRWVRLDEV